MGRAPENTLPAFLIGIKRCGADMIELDVAKRRLQLLVSDEELAKRRAAWKPPKPHATRGYVKMYVDTVNQASEGADLDFLVGKSGRDVPRDNH